MASLRPSLLRSSGLRAPSAASRRTVLVCKAQQEKQQQESSFFDARALPMAGLVAVSLIAGGFNPEEALAGGSGGRSGGSSGFSSRRAAAPSRNAVTRSTTTNTVVVGAPPVYAAPMFSPFGFSPFGGFGYGVGLGFGGFGMLSSLFSFFILISILGVVFNVISSFAQNRGNDSNGKKKDDGWGDL